MKSSSKRKAPIKSKDFKPPPNQRVMTQFFKPNPNSASPVLLPAAPAPVISNNDNFNRNGDSSTSSSISITPLYKITTSDDDGAGSSKNSKPIQSSLKEGDVPIVTISDSESEHELQPETLEINATTDDIVPNSNLSTSMADNVRMYETQVSVAKLEPTVSQENSGATKPIEISPSPQVSTPSGADPGLSGLPFGSDSEDEILSQLDMNEIIGSQENSGATKPMEISPSPQVSTPSGADPGLSGLPFDSDSEDEILSQLDMNEIIGSQDNWGTPRTQGGCSSRSSTSTQILTPPIINQTPTKLVKPKINRFSTLQKINSRSPESKGRNVKNSAGKSSSKSSSGKKSSSPKKPQTPDRKAVVSNSPSSVVKKLQFPDALASTSSAHKVPYYLKHFSIVLDSVTSDPLNNNLLNEEDKFIIAKFRGLSFNAKCLFVRLYHRKWDWKTASSIDYPLIKKNLTSVFEELHASVFLVEIKDVQDELELETVLKILNGEQITTLGKQMNANSKVKTKAGVISSLLALSKTKPAFVTYKTTADQIQLKALEIMGRCYQVEGSHRALFTRMFIMHSPPQYWEDEQEQSSNQTSKMFLAEDGKMLFPQYNINKKTALYQDRDDLIRFHVAWTMHCDITSHTQSKDWEEVIKIGENALLLLRKILDDVDVQTRDQSLPQFLRIYKEGSVLTRVLWLSVEGYQKLKQYQVASQHIDFLLSQSLYLIHYRGHWYERLAVNQKQHLKLPLEKRKETLQIALQDTSLLESHKLCMSDKYKKLLEEIQKPPKKKRKKTKRSQDEEDTDEETESAGIPTYEAELLFDLNQELPTRTIYGEKLLNPNSGKSVFVTQQDADGSSEASSVELFSKWHYRTHLGYEYGVHAEGSSVCSLFGLLFWDEIYSDEINDTFHSQHQSYPLDMHFEDFFIRREGIILDKLNGMRSSWSIDDSVELVEKNWNQHYGELSLVNWNVLSESDIKVLLKRLGLQVTASICEKLARNYRHWRSGFPDLVLWNDQDAIFVEVKGPGDTLSNKQRVWLDFLLSIGAKAEVCHVQAVSNKKIKT